MLDSNRKEVLHVAPFVSFNTTKKRQKMTKDDFTSKLHTLNLSKKEFAKLCDLSYSTINNWNDTTRPIPLWVTSWLENYELAKKYRIIENLLKDSNLFNDS